MTIAKMEVIAGVIWLMSLWAALLGRWEAACVWEAEAEAELEADAVAVAGMLAVAIAVVGQNWFTQPV